MTSRKNYPIISVFIDEVYSISKEQHSSREEVITDVTLNIASYPKISSNTIEKSLGFSNDLIKYFTPTLLLHHYQDEVPIFTLYLGVDEEKVDINTYGGYYTKIIQNIPSLQNLLDELFGLIRTDLNIEDNNLEDILMELETMPRLDVKDESHLNKKGMEFETSEPDWNFTRVIRTPNSEMYALYMDEISAGEIHLHIGRDINATIITTLDITEKEKAQLMGFVHEKLLETLEEELDKTSTISFYSEAVEDI